MATTHFPSLSPPVPNCGQGKGKGKKVVSGCVVLAPFLVLLLSLFFVAKCSSSRLWHREKKKAIPSRVSERKAAG